MIVSLAFDTFSQQALTVDFRQVADTQNLSAAIPVPHSSYYGVDQPRSEHWISYSLMGNILQGVFSDNTTTLQAICATGNCDYPVVPSLDVCGGCTNVTNKLRNRSCPGLNCTYYLPDGFSMPLVANQSKVNGLRNVFKIGSTGGDIYHNNLSNLLSVGGPYNPFYLANFETIGTINQSHDTSHLSARECALWLCVQAFNVSVRSGRQYQSTLTSVRLSTQRETNSYLSPTFHRNLTSRQTPLSAFINILSKTSALSLNDTIFEENIENLTDTTLSENIASAMWRNHGNLDAWVQNLTLTISNYFRLSAPAANDAGYYMGTAYSTEAFVRVRWPWLVFPALLVLASVGFFLATVWRTWRADVRVWKSSALALLMVEVDESLKAAAEGSGGDVQASIDKIGQRNVCLEERDGHWKFLS
ncbi:hypothetical protein MMC30_006023 [Trapelia coarctata]|nr:hypothetical protein [Trapelia coarctata]